MKYFFIAQSALIEPVSAQQSILFVYCTTLVEIHLLEGPDKGHSTVKGKQEKTDPWSSNSLLPS